MSAKAATQVNHNEGVMSSSHPQHHDGDASTLPPVSLPALNHAFNSVSTSKKTAWFSVVVISLFVTVNHTISVLTRYYARPITILITLVNNNTMTFPAVTICNLNPIALSKVTCEEMDQLTKIQQRISPMLVKQDEFQKTLLAVYPVQINSIGEEPQQFMRNQPSTRFLASSAELQERCKLKKGEHTASTRNTTGSRMYTTPMSPTVNDSTSDSNATKTEQHTFTRETSPMHSATPPPSNRRKRQTPVSVCPRGQTARFCRVANFTRTEDSFSVVDTDNQQECQRLCEEQFDTETPCKSFSIAEGQCHLSSTIIDPTNGDDRLAASLDADGSYHELLCLEDADIPKTRNQTCQMFYDYAMYKVKRKVDDITSLGACVHECLAAEDMECHSAAWYPQPNEHTCLLSTEARLSLPDSFYPVGIETIYVDFGYDGTIIEPEEPCCPCECRQKRKIPSMVGYNETSHGKKLKELQKTFGSGDDEDDENKKRKNGWTTSTTTAKPLKHDLFGSLEGRSEYDFEDFVQDSKLDDLVDIQDLVSITPELADQYSPEITDFIYECTFDRDRCVLSREFVPIVNKRYGKCYTFNRLLEGRKLRTTRNSGANYGLRLTLNVNMSEYVGLLASAYGVQVSVHPPDTQPLPDEEGFTAITAKETSVAVRRQEIIRLPKPFRSNCTKVFPEKYIQYLQDPSERYSLSMCQLACTDYHMHEHCKCVENSQNFELCSIFNEQQRDCREEINERMTLNHEDPNSLLCECEAPCFDVRFQHEVSLTSWPSEEYLHLKVLNFADRHPLADKFMSAYLKDAMSPQSDVLHAVEEMKQNFVRIHVYLKSMTIEVQSEEEAYPSSTVLADIGGICGCYMGLTVVAFIELMDLFWNILTGCCCKRRNKTAQTQSTELSGVNNDVFDENEETFD